MAVAGSAQTPVHLAGYPQGDPEFQAPVPLLATPWMLERESGGIVYFACSSPAKIERFDLASGTAGDTPVAS